MKTAALLVDEDPDRSASSAYYAAFYAVQAVLAARGQTYARHKAVEVAVHRDFVGSGRWTKEEAAAFPELVRLRYVADYGGDKHATATQAREAVEAAARLIAAARRII